MLEISRIPEDWTIFYFFQQISAACIHDWTGLMQNKHWKKKHIHLISQLAPRDFWPIKILIKTQQKACCNSLAITVDLVHLKPNNAVNQRWVRKHRERQDLWLHTHLTWWTTPSQPNSHYTKASTWARPLAWAPTAGVRVCTGSGPEKASRSSHNSTHPPLC